MSVWIIKEICDYEYGCREVKAVFATAEDAEKYVEDNNEMIDFWTGAEMPSLTVEEYEVL